MELSSSCHSAQALYKGSPTADCFSMFSNVSRSTAGSLAIASGRRRVARLAPLAACALSFASAAQLHAQSIFSTPSPRQQAESLARTSGFTTITRGKSGTAFFVDDVGHMLTARHAVGDCVRLVVDKEGYAMTASVVALRPVRHCFDQGAEDVGASGDIPRQRHGCA